MSIPEMMRLQGMHPDELKVVVPSNEFGKQLGNAMSLNVIERVLFRVLEATGLVTRGSMVDRWQSTNPQFNVHMDGSASRQAQQILSFDLV